MRIFFEENQKWHKHKLRDVPPTEPFRVDDAIELGIAPGMYVRVDGEEITYSIGQSFVEIRSILFPCKGLLPANHVVKVPDEAVLVIGSKI